ncbi:MAG TPA: glycosyltransferase [bacterium]|nr:glycosyltransferase [bacterium]
MSKICLITAVFSPYTKGGAEVVVNNIVNGFKNKNQEILVITVEEFRGWRSLWPKKYLENNVPIYRFYPLNLFSFININKYAARPFLRLIWHGLDMFNVHSYLVIKHILKQEKPTVVMTHMLKGIGYLTCRAIKKLNIKNIHTLHEVQLATPSGLILKGEENSWQHTCLLTKLYQSFNRWLFNSPEIVISSSKFLLNFYNQRNFFPHSKKIILTNPVNLPTVNLQTAKHDSEEFNFLFLGQVEVYKGILLLINVFKKLTQETNNEAKIFLNIVGTGSGLEAAKKLANNHPQINFMGYVANNKLGEIFSKTNATVVTSLCYENSPTVIFESLAYGVPVLAAKIGGIEFIKDDYNGFTFEAGDENDLLRVLKFALQNKNRLTELSSNCRESVKEIGVGDYINHLESLI